MSTFNFFDFFIMTSSRVIMSSIYDFFHTQSLAFTYISQIIISSQIILTRKIAILDMIFINSHLVPKNYHLRHDSHRFSSCSIVPILRIHLLYISNIPFEKIFSAESLIASARGFSQTVSTSRNHLLKWKPRIYFNDVGTICARI